MSDRHKKRRRPRGCGTIFFDRRRGVWIGRIPVGRVNGCTKYREVSHPKQSVCIQLMARIAPPGPDITVADFALQWLDSLHVRPSTKDNYTNSVVNRINPVLGRMRLAAVTPLQVEHVIKQWAAIYQTGTVRLTLAHLSMVFKAAIRAELITRNPVSLAKKPRPDPRRFNIYPPAVLRDITAAALERPWTRPIALLAATGMRAGEVVALQVEDFDRAAGTVAITKTDTRHHGTGPPKSRNSVRTIRIPADALPAVVAAAGTRRTGPLFLGLNGRGITKGGIDWQWKKLCKRLGITRHRPHSLRHSFCSCMVAAGVPLADLARYAGDAVGEIVKSYTHPVGLDPSVTMDRLFRNGRGKKGRA